MKITLPLMNPAFDDNELKDKLLKEFDNRCQIYIYKDESEWISSKESHVFGLWIEYGMNKKAIMFDIDLDNLEMFANSLLKSIEMLRRDYSDILKDKIENGDCI